MIPYGVSTITDKCYQHSTYAQAQDLCNSSGARLCTKDELESQCTSQGTLKSYLFYSNLCYPGHNLVWTETSVEDGMDDEDGQ